MNRVVVVMCSLGLAVGSCLVGCVTAPASARSTISAKQQQEIDAAEKESDLCFYDKTVEFDDGVSPANVIGDAVGRECYRLYIRYGLLYTQYFTNDGYRTGYFSGYRKSAGTTGTRWVLLYRSQKSKQTGQ
jgi:hypothetical protein